LTILKISTRFLNELFVVLFCSGDNTEIDD